jgi:hypothetical protein
MNAEDNISFERKRGPGAPIGNCNNPYGRGKGTKNKIQYDIRKTIYEKVNDTSFINDFFEEIERVENPEKRARIKLELFKMFIPRPLNGAEQDDLNIRSAIYNKLARNSHF